MSLLPPTPTQHLLNRIYADLLLHKLEAFLSFKYSVISDESSYNDEAISSYYALCQEMSEYCRKLNMTIEYGFSVLCSEQEQSETADSNPDSMK